MRVAFTHNKVACHVVVLAHLKSVDVARGNALRSQHHGHRRGEIFAMPGASLKQEIGQRIVLRRSAQIQRVAKVRAQVALDRTRFIEWIGIGSR